MNVNRMKMMILLSCNFFKQLNDTHIYADADILFRHFIYMNSNKTSAAFTNNDIFKFLNIWYDFD